jgi:hypothetical protein
LLNSIVLPIGFVFRWGASTMLLRNFYQRMAKLPLSFWIVLSLPLIFYLVGKMPGFFAGESFAGVGRIGSAQTEKELLARAVRLLKANREEMEVETGGVSYALTEDDIRDYIVQVIQEKKWSK